MFLGSIKAPVPSFFNCSPPVWPKTGVDLTSQPTVLRWENGPDLRTLIRWSQGLVDLWCESYRCPPKAINLDIDDTPDVVYGHQQLSLFNAHYDERCSVASC
jgi:hypothetical protein